MANNSQALIAPHDWDTYRNRKTFDEQIAKAWDMGNVDVAEAMFAHRQQLVEQEDEAQVLLANKRFYKAITHKNAEMMEKLWIKDKEAPVSCIHPSMRRITGCGEVIQSWREILGSNYPALQIVPEKIKLELRGGLAWIQCEEIVTHPNLKKTMRFLATNVFTNVEGVWYLVIHHASEMKKGRRIAYIPNTREDERGLVLGDDDDDDEDDDDDDDDDDDEDDDDDDEYEDADEEDDDDDDDIVQQIREVVQKRVETLKKAIEQRGLSVGQDAAIVISAQNDKGRIMRLLKAPQTSQPSDGSSKASTENPNRKRENTEDDTHLASATLAAIRWLHDQGRISSEEKAVLSFDVISASTKNTVAKAEMAYTLLIGDLTEGEGSRYRSDSNSEPLMEMADAGDVEEFTTQLHIIAMELLQNRKQ